MTGPLARIFLRYLSAALVTYGLVDENTGHLIAGDADLLAVVQIVVGFVLMAGTESYYALAKRYGWST